MKLQSIKILADENISPKVVKFLRDFGFDVIDVKEKNWHGSEDEKLLNIALEEKRFILSHDSDFGTLAINRGKKFYGIIFLRLKNSKSDNVINVLNQILQKNLDIHPGNILVIEERRIRIRSPLL